MTPSRIRELIKLAATIQANIILPQACCECQTNHCNGCNALKNAKTEIKAATAAPDELLSTRPHTA